MKYLFVFFSLAFWSSSLIGEHKTKYVVGYATVSERLSSEDSAALSFLQKRNNFITRIIHVSQTNTDLNKIDLLWIHIPDSATYHSWSAMIHRLRKFKSLYQEGKKFLFTDYAAMLPYELGIESQKPEIKILDIQNDWLFDQKGFQSYHGHPIFNELFGGTFVWDTDHDHKLPSIGYFGNDFPQQGKSIAVEKSTITIHSNNKLVIEHSEGEGKIISIGGFIFFSQVNQLQNHTDKVIGNTLRYLFGELKGRCTYWQRFENKPKNIFVSSRPARASMQRKLVNRRSSGLLIQNDHPQNNSFDVGGRRALVMGNENGGVDEIWNHPFRILRDYQVGLVSRDSVSWLQNVPVTIEVRPESFTRVYQTQYGLLKEIVFASYKEPGSIIHYEFIPRALNEKQNVSPDSRLYRKKKNPAMADTMNSHDAVTLFIKFRSDLRLMWPYDVNAIGDLYFGYDNSLNALHLTDVSGDYYCIFGGDVKPLNHISGAYENINWSKDEFRTVQTQLNQVYHGAVYELNRNNNFTLNYVAVGTNEGKKSALKTFTMLMKNPERVYNENVEHYKTLLKSRVTIESPEKEFNDLYKWALVGTDRFVTTTPGIGTALVAGFGTTARGWDGAQKISGRPGYAWYFGRDSEWSCFAIDDYGDFNVVKDQLLFLQKYQDLSGKIFHELSTSSVVHYDASDATPLYIILAAHYLRASGDKEFIKQIWSSIKKAMDFLYSTDTDGDGLIENTNVGHGWVEGGALFGVHTEFYLAGLWAQALKDAAYIASYIGQIELREKFIRDADRVQKILNTDFWNPTTEFFNHGKMKDGSYHQEKTVLAAVPMTFGLLDENKVKYSLHEYESNSFSSDWGTRIIQSTSPLFNPQGYHYGSVWPLFTGWTALAEYEYGNSTQGFMHITNNMKIKNHWALGFVEEVMHGAVYKPSGVCPHQCWSETNILHPAITGMIGWKPDAATNSVTIKPRFPLHWDSVTVHNLHIGKSFIRMKCVRIKTRTRYQFKLLRGPSVMIRLAPEIPVGMVIKNVDLNDTQIHFSSKISRGLLAEPIQFKLDHESNITINHSGGFGMIPIQPSPLPGDSSDGYRIISTTGEQNAYTVLLEGKSGTSHAFEAMIFDQKISSIDSARVEPVDENGRVKIAVEFDPSKERFVEKQITLHLK